MSTEVQEIVNHGGSWYTHCGTSKLVSHFFAWGDPLTGDKSLCGRKKFGHNGIPIGGAHNADECRFCRGILNGIGKRKDK